MKTDLFNDENFLSQLEEELPMNDLPFNLLDFPNDSLLADSPLANASNPAIYNPQQVPNVFQNQPQVLSSVPHTVSVQNIENFPPQNVQRKPKPNPVNAQVKQQFQRPATVIISSAGLAQASQQFVYSNLQPVQANQHIILQNSPKVLPVSERLQSSPQVLVQNVAQLSPEKMQLLLQV